MDIKKLPKFVLVLLYAMYFCAGFALIYGLLVPYIAEKNTQIAENDPSPYFEVLAFAPDDVRIVYFGNLNEFKRQNPEYSFLVPKERKKEFIEQLDRDNKGADFDIEVVQISEERQLVTFSTDDIRSLTVNKYEATAREVFPRTVRSENFRNTLQKAFPSVIGGFLISFIFSVFYRKYLTK